MLSLSLVCVALICWKLTVLTIGARLQLSPWTLSFRSNSELKFYSSQNWIIIQQSAADDFIKICTVNIFPCALHIVDPKGLNRDTKFVDRFKERFLFVISIFCGRRIFQLLIQVSDQVKVRKSFRAGVLFAAAASRLMQKFD